MKKLFLALGILLANNRDLRAPNSNGKGIRKNFRQASSLVNHAQGVRNKAIKAQRIALANRSKDDPCGRCITNLSTISKHCCIAAAITLPIFFAWYYTQNQIVSK